jgi:hypothetical protein
MIAEDQVFVVADIVSVGQDVALHSKLPSPGTLLVLQPPCAVGDHELTGWSVTVEGCGSATTVLNYEHWYLSPAKVIGLLFREIDASAVPLGAQVRFVKRVRDDSRVAVVA